MEKMTDKQRLFCTEYVSCFNATQAAIRAGYSSKTAYSIGNELLNKPEIKEFIDDYVSGILENKHQLLARVISELSIIAFTSYGDFLDGDNRLYLNDEKLKALKKVSTNGQGIITDISLHDKQRALEALMKYLDLTEPVAQNVTEMSTEELLMQISEDIRKASE